LQEKERLSRNHIFTIKATFDHICLYLVLLGILSSNNFKNLNSYKFVFAHLHKMIRKIKLKYIHDLFDYNLSYTF